MTDTTAAQYDRAETERLLKEWNTPFTGHDYTDQLPRKSALAAQLAACDARCAELEETITGLKGLNIQNESIIAQLETALALTPADCAGTLVDAAELKSLKEDAEELWENLQTACLKIALMERWYKANETQHIYEIEGLLYRLRARAPKGAVLPKPPKDAARAGKAAP